MWEWCSGPEQWRYPPRSETAIERTRLPRALSENCPYVLWAMEASEPNLRGSVHPYVRIVYIRTSATTPIPLEENGYIRMFFWPHTTTVNSWSSKSCDVKTTVARRQHPPHKLEQSMARTVDFTRQVWMKLQLNHHDETEYVPILVAMNVLNE